MKSLNVTHLNQEQKEQLADKLRSHIERVKEQKDPNIIRYISVDIDKEINNTVSILMEYIPAGSIYYILKFFKSFKETLSKNYMKQIVRGVQHLHERGIVHRDIKTSN